MVTLVISTNCVTACISSSLKTTLFNSVENYITLIFQQSWKQTHEQLDLICLQSSHALFMLLGVLADSSTALFPETKLKFWPKMAGLIVHKQRPNMPAFLCGIAKSFCFIVLYLFLFIFLLFLVQQMYLAFGLCSFT